MFSHGRQFFKSENFAEYGGDAQHFVAVLADAIETIADRFFDALRDQQLGHVAAMPATALATHRAALDQRLQHFLDKERIAFRLAMHRKCKLATDVLAQQRAELILELMGHQGLGWEGDGFTPEELDAVRGWLGGKAMSIYGGSFEIQNNIIAKNILGLPETTQRG